MTQKWSNMQVAVAVAVVMAVLIVGSIGVSIIFLKDTVPPLVLKVLDESERGEKGVESVGCGWSIKNNETEAVEEAYSSARMRLQNEPNFIILFSTPGYDSEHVLRAVRNLAPDAQVFGGTSSTAVLTTEGFHAGEGKNGSLALALLAISSKEITFSVAGAN